MERLDLRREWKSLYTAGKRPDLVEVPPRQAISITQTGLPGADTMGPLFQALYPVAYSLKFALKAQRAIDYPVLPAEATFRMSDFTRTEGWRWIVSIAVPDIVDAAAVRQAVRHARDRADIPLLNRVQLRPLATGLHARILHVGPYDAEQPTVDRVLEFIRAQGLRPGRTHTEIYLSDPARVPPERTRTVIRIPAIA